jgi:hypothetical protein
VFLLVAKLVAMQREEIIADLADRVAHRDSDEASAAVRQLGAMPRPPAAVLVAAAAAADRDVANEAQQMIGKLLRRSQQQIEAGRSVKAVARQLSELAEALAENREAFPAADQLWLASTTQRILRLANQLPAKHTPVVATHCDLILTSIPTTDVADASSDRPPEEGNVGALPSAWRGHDVQDSIATPSSGHGTRPSADARSNDSADASLPSDRSRPVFRMLPATPKNTAPINTNPSPPRPWRSNLQTPPADLEIINRPYAGVDSRTLLRRWFVAEGDEVIALERELAKQRNFGQLSKPLVHQFLSDRAQDRLQLVDDVLTTPGVDARPWLMLLADDADADVRLSAVTIMATSTDAALVEKAWQAAIHDRDPRIAALADRLRERRAATQRR